MGIFYERIETDESVIIKYRYLPIYYLVYILVVFGAIFLGRLGGIGCLIAPILIIIGIGIYLDMRKPNSEIKKAMKKGQVKFSGSKFSFSNPIVAEIPKELLKEEATSSSDS